MSCPTRSRFPSPLTFSRDSGGRRYELTVESPDAVAGDTVALWREVDGAPDAADGLWVGDKPLPGRLVFQPRYCRAPASSTGPG